MPSLTPSGMKRENSAYLCSLVRNDVNEQVRLHGAFPPSEDRQLADLMAARLQADRPGINPARRGIRERCSKLIADDAMLLYSVVPHVVSTIEAELGVPTSRRRSDPGILTGWG